MFRLLRKLQSSITGIQRSFRLVSEYLRSISINTRFAPTPRGIFDLTTLALISQACDILVDPPLFRAIFLLAFFAFLRMSNIAPHSRFKFDAQRHFLRQDVIFAEPGAHILIKWTKTLQDSSARHFVQIPVLKNVTLCPVLALRKLLDSRPFPPSSPLFIHPFPPFHPVIDTTIRDALRKVLVHIGVPLVGHGFHAFRRSGATLLTTMSSYSTLWHMAFGLFVYLGFCVAFNTVQVISRRVVGRAEETRTYSSLGFCTVNCRPTASNYQLSHLRP